METMHYEDTRIMARLYLNGADVTEELSENLEKITYTDIANGETDTLEAVLFCGGDELLGSKRIPKGTEIEAIVYIDNIKNAGDRREIDCGSFLVDEISAECYPTEMTVGAVAVPVIGTENTRTWENMSIEAIARDICSSLGCVLEFSGEDIVLEEKKQSQDRDISFLFKLCSEYGKGMTVYRKKIAIYDNEALDAQEAVMSFDIRKAALSKSIELNDTMDGQYTGVEAHYKTEGSDDDSIYNLGTSERVIVLDNAGKSLREAQMKARASLYEANSREVTLRFETALDDEFFAGLNYMIEGLGEYSGKYGADKVEHTYGRGGYKQKVTAHAIDIARK